MNSFLIALMLAAGVAAFVWTKVSRSTGNADPKQVYVISAIAGGAIFVVTYITLWAFMG